MNDILWRRLRYMLTPQFDLYVHIAPKVAGLDVLDIGCGTGFGTLQLAKQADMVNGLDVNADAIEFAHTLEFERLRFSVADICETQKFAPHAAAVMVEVLEHVKDWRLALANVNNLLRPGGSLYITARNRNADLRRNDLHEREWSAQEFVAALREFFPNVVLYDYTLERELGPDTRVTPLIAVATK